MTYAKRPEKSLTNAMHTMTMPQQNMIRGTEQSDNGSGSNVCRQWVDSLHLDGLRNFIAMFLRTSPLNAAER